MINRVTWSVTSWYFDFQYTQTNYTWQLTAVQLKTTSSLGIIIISKDFMELQRLSHSYSCGTKTITLTELDKHRMPYVPDHWIVVWKHINKQTFLGRMRKKTQFEIEPSFFTSDQHLELQPDHSPNPNRKHKKFACMRRVSRLHWHLMTILNCTPEPWLVSRKVPGSDAKDITF
jgi:hypothetical protein